MQEKFHIQKQLIKWIDNLKKWIKRDNRIISKILLSSSLVFYLFIIIIFSDPLSLDFTISDWSISLYSSRTILYILSLFCLIGFTAINLRFYHNLSSRILLILSFVFYFILIIQIVITMSITDVLESKYSELTISSIFSAGMVLFYLIGGFVLKMKHNPSFFNLFKNKYFYFHAIAACVVCLLLFLAYYNYIQFHTDHGEEFELRNYRSLSVKDAKEQIKKDGLEYIVFDSVFTDSVPKGTVFTQHPLSGTSVKKGRKIYITINRSASQKFKVPDVFNKSERAAVNQLNRHFKVELVKTTSYSSVTSVVTRLMVGDSEVFPGQKLIEGTTVSVYFGSGRGISTIIVPNLLGKTKYNAHHILEQNNLRLGEIIAEGEINDTLSAIVLNQRPLFQTKLQSGDMVDIVIRQFSDTIMLIDSTQN